jgi:nucleoside 2-deoxyribosyltransferase
MDEIREDGIYMADVFLICPVRGVTKEQEFQIREYVNSLEDSGLVVHWPQRDTKQDDFIGDMICAVNRQAIEDAKEIHVWWTTTSTGTMFDLGMAWALKKPLIIANPQEVSLTEGKSFQNVLLNWGFQI